MRETNKNIPEWIRPNLQKERGELMRVTSGFLGREANEETIRFLIEILEHSQMTELSDADWQALENTDSFQNVALGQIEKAEKINAKYNEVLEGENKRDFTKLLAGFNSGNKMECPVIVRNGNGTLHLVSGNTRLMITRALGVRPKIVSRQID